MFSLILDGDTVESRSIGISSISTFLIIESEELTDFGKNFVNKCVHQ